MQIHEPFFKIEKQAVTSFVLRKQITGPFHFCLVLSLSAAGTHNIERLFGRAWVMASADLCCHSDSGGCGTNNNIINSLSGTRRSTGDQRQTDRGAKEEAGGPLNACKRRAAGGFSLSAPPHRP